MTAVAMHRTAAGGGGGGGVLCVLVSWRVTNFCVTFCRSQQSAAG